MLKPGDIAQFHNLANDSTLNGEYVEILTELVDKAVPEFDGIVREAPRYGVEIIRTKQTGYAKPENLLMQPGVTRRSVNVHLFGWEE